MSALLLLLNCVPPPESTPAGLDRGRETAPIDTDGGGDTDPGDSDTGHTGDSDEPRGWRLERIDGGATRLPSWEAPITAIFETHAGFGPRLLDGRDDFHLGLDLHAPRHTPVRAMADGTTFRVRPSKNPSDPHTLYIEHVLDEPVSFHGQAIDRVYAVYSHLQSFDVDEGQPVVAGQQVGTVGDSGGAEFTHLHVELRLGTHCSLRYSEDNPDSGCARDYDPAVNPLHALPGYDPALPTIEVLSEQPLTVRIATRLTDQDLNRIESDLGVVDLDLREGFDATTSEGLDDFDYGWLRLTPEADDGAHRVWVLRFEQQPAWVEITDLAGAGWRLTP